MLLPEFAKPLFDVFEQEGEELYIVGTAAQDWALMLLDTDPHKSDCQIFGKENKEQWNKYCDYEAYDGAYHTKTIEFATTAYPERINAILYKHAFPSYLSNRSAHGSISTMIEDVKCEIVTYRKLEKGYGTVHGKTLDDELNFRAKKSRQVALDSSGRMRGF